MLKFRRPANIWQAGGEDMFGHTQSVEFQSSVGALATLAATSHDRNAEEEISTDELRDLQVRAFWTKFISYVRYSVSLGIPIFIIANLDLVVSTMASWPTYPFVPNSKYYVLYLLGVAVIYYAGLRLGLTLLSWRIWLKIRAKSNDTFDKIHAVLALAEDFAGFRHLGARCLILAIAGYMLFYRFAGPDFRIGAPEVGIFVASTLLVLVSYKLHTRRLGILLVDNLLFIAVQAEAAPIGNQDVHVEVAERLSPKFRRERPEHYY